MKWRKDIKAVREVCTKTALERSKNKVHNINPNSYEHIKTHNQGLACLIFATVRDSASKNVVNICFFLNNFNNHKINQDNNLINNGDENGDKNGDEVDRDNNSGKIEDKKSHLNQNMSSELLTDADAFHSPSAETFSILHSNSDMHSNSPSHPSAFQISTPSSPKRQSKHANRRQQHITTSSSNHLEVTIFQNSKIFQHLFFIHFQGNFAFVISLFLWIQKLFDKMIWLPNLCI